MEDVNGTHKQQIKFKEMTLVELGCKTMDCTHVKTMQYREKLKQSKKIEDKGSEIHN